MASELKNRAILVEVLRNRFQAVVEEMGALILRAGHTVFVKETATSGRPWCPTGARWPPPRCPPGWP